MSNAAIVEKENAVLKEQILQLRYYLAGSHGLTWVVPDVAPGDSVFCAKDKLHEIAAGFLTPADICVDIGPGIRPQRLLTCKTHILIEPYDQYCAELIKRYPQKMTIKSDGITFLGMMDNNSVDTIFLLDVIEHLEKDDGLKLLAEARRVARKQIVIFTPLGFMPQHYSEIGNLWGNITHNELQNHLSGWLPEEFPGSTTVIAENYHTRGDHSNGAFYAIIPCGETSPSSANNAASFAQRLVVVTEPITDFVFQESDMIIADIGLMELSWMISNVPKRNCLYAPLILAAEHASEPIEFLRSTIINFESVEHYISIIKNKVTIGAAALMIVEKITRLLVPGKK